MGHLSVGVGRTEITPSPGTPQGGWGAQTHQRGLGSDMPFYASALALSDGNELILIVEADAIGFDLEWTDKILAAIQTQTGVSREQIRFSCSHTHSGPNTFRLATISDGLEMVLSYLKSLPERIAGAAWQATRNLQKVRVASGCGSCDINIYRRCQTPDGARVSGLNAEVQIDRIVRVVRFDDLNERPVAIVVHYACHPTIMAWENQYFTPDYPGVVRKIVEQHVGGMCLFLQGAAGDIGPRAGYTGDLQVYRREGTTLGLEAAKVSLNLDTLPRRHNFTGVLQSGAPIALYLDEAQEPQAPALRMASRKLALPLRKLRPLSEVEAETKTLKKNLEMARGTGDEAAIRNATARFTQANWYADMVRQNDGKTTIDWETQAIRIGSIALLSTRGEPFNEVSRKVVAGSPFPQTLVSGYSNGGFGYIPTRQAFEEGGYEIDASPFAPGAAELLAEESLQMLHAMA